MKNFTAIAQNNSHTVYCNYNADSDISAVVIGGRESFSIIEEFEILGKIKMCVITNNSLIIISNRVFCHIYNNFKEVYKMTFERDIFIVEKVRGGFKIYTEDDKYINYSADIDADVYTVGNISTRFFNIYKLNIGSMVYKNDKNKKTEIFYSKYDIDRSMYSYSKNKVLAPHKNKVILIDVLKKKKVKEYIFDFDIRESYYLNTMTKLILTSKNNVFLYSEKYGLKSISEEYNLPTNIYNIYPLNKDLLLVSMKDYIIIINLKNNKLYKSKFNIKELCYACLENDIIIITEKETRLSYKLPMGNFENILNVSNSVN